MSDIPLCKCCFCPHSIVKLGKMSCKHAGCILDWDDMRVILEGLKGLYK